MSSGKKVLFCLAVAIFQVYAITTFNLSATSETEVAVSSSLSITFAPTPSAFASVSLANASTPSYVDPTQSAPGSYSGLTFVVTIWDSASKFTMQPSEPAIASINMTGLTDFHQLYLWNSVVRKWYLATSICNNNETSTLENGALSVPLCHIGQFALYSTNVDGAAPIQDNVRSSDGPSKEGIIAAAVIIPIVVVIIVIVIVYMFMIRYRQKKNRRNDAESQKGVSVTDLTSKPVVIQVAEQESVDSYSSNSSASSVSSKSSYTEDENKANEVVVPVPAPVVENKEVPPQAEEKDSVSSASSSSSSSSSSSESDSDYSSSESDN